jgi:TetR/AcrR family transcriptional regulator, cholesterol catabolism regulator
MESLPRPDRPKLRDRYDRKQQQVVRDAAKLFAERGYNQTTIQDLAEAIDLAAGGIYHYVGSKERLLAMICDQLMDPLLEQAHELLAIEGDAATQLRELVRLWVAHVTEHRNHMLVFQQERHVIEHGARWRAQRQSRKRFERVVEDVVKRVDAAGQLRLDDDRLALWALLGMVNYTPQWFRSRGWLSTIDVADGYVDLLIDADSGRRRSAGRSAATFPEASAPAQTPAP